jgi:redox-sensitive bicupin YhaK (pirin superfamily)
MTEFQDKSVDIRRAGERFHTRIDWLDSWHSFSFGDHHDPKNIRHGLLLVNNDDIIAPGAGFPTHPHRDMEIVTWVLEGELEHRDSEGNQGVITPGLAQRMSAGSGIWHSEKNPNGGRPVRLIQMWVLPDIQRVKPGYEQLDISADLKSGALVPVASGRGHKGAISIHQRAATLWVARLRTGASVFLPDAPHVHLFVATGTALLENGGSLAQGDAARLTAAGARRVTADASSGTEILVWEMH